MGILANLTTSRQIMPIHRRLSPTSGLEISVPQMAVGLRRHLRRRHHLHLLHHRLGAAQVAHCKLALACAPLTRQHSRPAWPSASSVARMRLWSDATATLHLYRRSVALVTVIHDVLVIFFVYGFECASSVILDVARKIRPTSRCRLSYCSRAFGMASRRKS